MVTAFDGTEDRRTIWYIFLNGLSLISNKNESITQGVNYHLVSSVQDPTPWWIPECLSS